MRPKAPALRHARRNFVYDITSPRDGWPFWIRQALSRTSKALLPRYAGKVDVIYIDPPYNTGNEAALTTTTSIRR